MIIPSSAEIIEALQIHPLKVKNIYMFGSRVYGNVKIDSDYDFLVVANSMNESIEHRIGNYNIHVHTPDKFRKDLFDFDMHNLECIYAPNFARLQEKVRYDDANFQINRSALVHKTLTESYNTLQKVKLKLDSGEIEIAKKKLFHSFRVLDFAYQILKEGTILNFSSKNDLWKKIQGEKSTDWLYYKQTYLPEKVFLESLLQESVR